MLIVELILSGTILVGDSGKFYDYITNYGNENY